jgi:hypothetical protein
MLHALALALLDRKTLDGKAARRILRDASRQVRLLKAAVIDGIEKRGKS